MKKRMGPLAVILCMLTMNCLAEDGIVDKEHTYGAIQSCQEWTAKLEQVKAVCEDASVLEYLQMEQDDLALTQVALLNTVTKDETDTQDLEPEEVGLARRMRQEAAGMMITAKADAIETNEGYRILIEYAYTSHYGCLSSTVLDENDNAVLRGCTEFAEKGDQTVILYRAYHADIGYVSKLGVLLDQESISYIDSVVFGDQMELVLKPLDWSVGKQEIAEWNEDLLLPDKAFYSQSAD